jgi:hypothetical protein
MFRIDEFDPARAEHPELGFVVERGWVTVRRDIPEEERAGLLAANADLIWDGEGVPAAGAVRFVDTEPPL